MLHKLPAFHESTDLPEFQCWTLRSDTSSGSFGPFCWILCGSKMHLFNQSTHFFSFRQHNIHSTDTSLFTRHRKSVLHGKVHKKDLQTSFVWPKSIVTTPLKYCISLQTFRAKTPPKATTNDSHYVFYGVFERAINRNHEKSVYRQLLRHRILMVGERFHRAFACCFACDARLTPDTGG
jgi:hypothetical protein